MYIIAADAIKNYSINIILYSITEFPIYFEAKFFTKHLERYKYDNQSDISAWTELISLVV